MTPRSPARILARHCDRSLVTAASPETGLGCVGSLRIGPRRPWNVRFGNALYPAPQLRTGAPRRQGLHIGTWVAGARLPPPDLAFPTADVAALRRRTPPTIAPRRSIVTYADRTLNCVDCGVDFIHSAADQEFYAQKGFASDPKRCTSCRASRRAAREGGYDVRDIGGPRGYERNIDRPDREYFAVVCSSCGNQAQVPFRPRMDRPVYCSDCFRTVRPD
jgi:CxxC-x17-CxxC domain-containing protein